MSATDPVRETLRLFGRQCGFTRKSTTWHLRQAETVAVVNLQRSQWGAQYYINVALWLLPLGETDAPKENKCHVRTRLERLFPDADQLLARLLDLESTVDDTTRREQLGSLLETELIPLLRACSTIEGLRATPEGERFRRVSLVTGPAQALLGEQE